MDEAQLLALLERSWTGLRALADNPLARLAAIVVAPFLGFFVRGYFSRRAARDFIAAQLISAQRDLAKIAYGAGGGEGLREHVQDLIKTQTLARIEDLKTHARMKDLGAETETQIGLYRHSVGAYLDQWLKQQNNSPKLFALYETSCGTLHAALRAMGRYNKFKRAIETEPRPLDGAAARQPNALGYAAAPPG